MNKQNTNIIGAHSKFNHKMAHDFRVIQQQFIELGHITFQLLELYNQNPTGTIQNDLFMIAQKQTEILMLKNQLTTKKQKKFNKYAKNMFNNCMQIILDSSSLSQYATHFSKLNTQEKTYFGQILFNELNKKYSDTNTEPVQFHIKNDAPELNAYYDFQYTIVIQDKPKTTKYLYKFISCFIHEFSHYLYTIHPNKTPAGAQQSHIMRFAYNCIMTPSAHKQQPFEQPSYALSKYFSKHNFTKKLLHKINQHHK